MGRLIYPVIFAIPSVLIIQLYTSIIFWGILLILLILFLIYFYMNLTKNRNKIDVAPNFLDQMISEKLGGNRIKMRRPSQITPLESLDMLEKGDGVLEMEYVNDINYNLPNTNTGI